MRKRVEIVSESELGCLESEIMSNEALRGRRTNIVDHISIDDQENPLAVLF